MNKLYLGVDGEHILMEFNELREQWEYHLMTYNLEGKALYWTRAGNQEFQKYLCESNCAKHIGNNIKYPFLRK